MSRTVARNVVALGLAQGVTLVLGFVLWVHLGRALGAEGLGMVAFGLALGAYFVLAVTLGFDAVAVREAARTPGREAEIVRPLLGVRLALALAATATFAAVVLTLRLGRVYQAVVLVLGARVAARAVQLDWVYQARERMGVVAARNVAEAGVMVALALALVHEPDDAVWAAVALAIGPWVANVGVGALYVREAGWPRPSFDWRAWRALLVPALPLTASALVSMIYYNADKLVLEALRTTAEVGLYEASYKLYALAIAVGGVLYLAFFPSLSTAHGSRASMRAAGRQFAGAMWAVGPPLALGAAVYAPELLALLFGAEYVAAALALRVLLVYAALVHVSMAFGVPLMAWDAETDYFRAVLTGGVANVVLNVLLIGPLGVTGAAVATLASESVVTVGMAVRYRQRTGTLLPDVAARAGVVAALGGLGPAAAAHALGVPIFGAVPLVLAATLGAAWASGLAEPRALLAAVLRRPAPSAAEAPAP